jgi:hypothetical protein
VNGWNALQSRWSYNAAGNGNRDSFENPSDWVISRQAPRPGEGSTIRAPLVGSIATRSAWPLATAKVMI